MNKILWLSRHEPQPVQVEELEKIFGTVDIIQVSTVINKVDEIIQIMKENNADEIVVVLPLNLISELLRQGVKPLRAVMERILKEDGDVEFRHSHFERIMKIEIITEKLGEE